MLKFRRQERLSENVTRSFSNLSTRSGSSSQLAPPSLTSPTKRERHSVSGPGAGKAISHDQISAPTRRVSQANVVQEAPSETDWRTKVVWTRHYQSVENMMHQRYERQMPKTSKLLKDVKNSDIVVLQASLEEIFAKLQRRIDQLGDQMDKADAEYLLSRYFNDFVQALKSYLRDCFSDGGEDMQPIPSGIMGDWKKLTRQVAQWNRAYMEHLVPGKRYTLIRPSQLIYAAGTS
ncbi:hypothetical protein DFS34DRAFT_148096 [Phlyctochytrium arcticum]|nr:hypothetical protein DFS34DRAFT_148096 [Phlyctochytrium arcticum]